MSGFRWKEQLQADLSQGDLPVVHLSLQDVPQDLDFTRILTADEQKRADAYQHEEDRLSFCAGRWLIRTSLDLWSGRGEAVPLKIGEKGKPCIQRPNSPQFNLSHANGELVLVLSGRGPVGVDVEDQTRSVRSVERLARRYFAEAEQRIVGEDDTAFFRIWTRREARVKAEGTGFASGFASLDTLEDERVGDWCYREWRISPSHIATLVHQAPVKTTRLYRLFPEQERLQRL